VTVGVAGFFASAAVKFFGNILFAILWPYLRRDSLSGPELSCSVPLIVAGVAIKSDIGSVVWLFFADDKESVVAFLFLSNIR